MHEKGEFADQTNSSPVKNLRLIIFATLQLGVALLLVIVSDK
jgi:hypothetical protein